jgi:general secretion pathway protein A
MMFTDHFQMTAHPFPETPPIDQILTDQRFSDALARLQYFTQDGSLALITGPTGMGKSSVLRLFSHHLNPTRFLPIYVHLTNLRASSLLKVMLTCLGEVPPARGKERLFLSLLDRARHSEQTLIFLLDESHLIPPDGLTDLRLLVSSALDEVPPIKIVLSGQDLLLQNLKKTSHLDLLHRISVRCHLRHLTPDETLLYIDFKLQSVGAPKTLFDPDAKALIHDYSGGVPRLINRIATSCLILAASNDLQKISEDLVNQTIAEFKLP